jgi:hypothetical protein
MKQLLVLVRRVVLLASLFGWTLAFTFPSAKPIQSRLTPAVGSRLFYTNDADGDEEDAVQTAYQNRSLAWTNQYRKLFPYESSRKHAISLGITSKEEWLDRAGGPYMIRRPDKMYQEEWVSWEEFLGTMRPYEETKQLVQGVLRIKNMDEYRKFVRGDCQRAEGLRIPVKPEIFYRDSGWERPEKFFGK